MNQYEDQRRVELTGEPGQAVSRRAGPLHEAGRREPTLSSERRRHALRRAMTAALIASGLLLARASRASGVTRAGPIRGAELGWRSRGLWMTPWRRPGRIERRLKEPEMIALLVGAASVAGVIGVLGRERRATPRRHPEHP